jgi:two-component system chemotaxis sensor kinase CheA
MARSPVGTGHTVRFAALGAAIGLVFPAAGLIIYFGFGHSSLALLIVSSITPLLLSGLAALAGRREDEAQHIRENLEEVVEDRTRSIQTLLDVTGDGFLSFGSNYIIKPEYSKPCEIIFGGPIAGKRFPDLLFAEDRHRGEFTDGLDLFFSGKAKSAVIFDLLDEQVQIHDRTYALEYREIDEATVMCSLTDVSDQQDLAAKIEDEERRRTLILRVVSNRKHFAGFLNEADRLFEILDAMAEEPSTTVSTERSQELAGQVHTFKGNANFVGFTRTGTVAHDLEDQLVALPIVQSDVDLSSNVFVLKRQFYDELNIVKKTLGARWINDLATISIPKRAIVRLEQYVRSAYPGDLKLAKALEHLRRVAMADLFSQFPQLIQDIAAARGRRVKPVKIDGGDFLVLPEQYEGLAAALTHVVRNMVDHGIESPSEREMRGKDPQGEIRIELRQTFTGIAITIADDGRGISLSAVEQIGRENGMIAPDETPSKSELLSLIFKPGFSTAEVSTTVSGKGIGLSAVQSAVAAVGGKLSVETVASQGTTFRVTIPIDRHR